MKKLILLFITTYCVFSSALAQNTNFMLNGKINGLSTGFLYLNYYDKMGNYVIDSAAIINNAFKFTGEIDVVRVAFLKSKKEMNLDDPNSVNFYIEQTNMSIEISDGDFKNFKLTGSKTENENNQLKLLKASINKELKPLHDAFSNAYKIYANAKKEKLAQSIQDSLYKNANAIRSSFEPFDVKLNKIDYDFINEHRGSYLSVFLLSMQLRNLSLDSASTYYNNLSSNVKQSGEGKALGQQILKLQKGSPGAIAFVFNANDIAGNPLSLADFKGKYVLLDFWASWCVPCRAGNPHLKKLYAQYKAKGFEIIGVADDDKTQDAWRNAVKQDEIGVWKHVLRGAKTANKIRTSINDEFLISTLPTKILIDRTGKIIGRYGSGGEDDIAMDKKLAEILGK